LTLKGRLRFDSEANDVVQRALLCKMFKCSPTELDEMEWDEVELLKEVYSEVGKKNPLMLFM